MTMDEKLNCVLFAIEMEIRFSSPTSALGSVCSSTCIYTHTHTSSNSHSAGRSLLQYMEVCHFYGNNNKKLSSC